MQQSEPVPTHKRKLAHAGQWRCEGCKPVHTPLKINFSTCRILRRKAKHYFRNGGALDLIGMPHRELMIGLTICSIYLSTCHTSVKLF